MHARTRYKLLPVFTQRDHTQCERAQPSLGGLYWGPERRGQMGWWRLWRQRLCDGVGEWRHAVRVSGCRQWANLPRGLLSATLLSLCENTRYAKHLYFFSCFLQSLISLMVSVDVNPFTAVLSAPSLWKRPVNAPDLKSLKPFPPSHAHEKGFLSNCTVLTVDLL